MICHICGADLPEGVTYCSICGSALTPEGTPEEQNMAEAPAEEPKQDPPAEPPKEDHKKDHLAEIHLDSGTEIRGRYRIQELLGRGGFCYTYHAFDNVLGVEVAIKEYFPHGIASRAEGNTVTVFTERDAATFEKGKRRFLEEARALAQFNKKQGIVSVYDFFEEFSTAYIVMEYLNGQNLREYRKSHGAPLDFPFVAYVAETMCDTLYEVHKKKIIHRDVSPDNIFLCDDGMVKLIDFGALNQLMKPVDTVTVILKTGYAPVEQYYRDGIQGSWTDIYGLGATLYNLLTGIVPPESVGRMVNDTLACPHLYNPEIPKNFSFAIMRAMEIKQEDRFADMQEFKQALLSTQPISNKYYEKYEAASAAGLKRTPPKVPHPQEDGFMDASAVAAGGGNGPKGTINILESPYHVDDTNFTGSDETILTPKQKNAPRSPQQQTPNAPGAGRTPAAPKSGTGNPPGGGKVNAPGGGKANPPGGGKGGPPDGDDPLRNRKILIGSICAFVVVLVIIIVVAVIASKNGPEEATTATTETTMTTSEISTAATSEATTKIKTTTATEKKKEPTTKKKTNYNNGGKKPSQSQKPKTDTEVSDQPSSEPVSNGDSETDSETDPGTDPATDPNSPGETPVDTPAPGSDTSETAGPSQSPATTQPQTDAPTADLTDNPGTDPAE